MNQQILILAITALSIGFFHTLFGPDHYLPFIVMSKARNWKIIKTLFITFLCGIGHVLSSIILGFIGIVLGIGVSKLEFFEGFRGNIAAYLLIGFGFVYFIWGIRKAIKNKPHTHLHSHNNKKHIHTHTHSKQHSHIHDDKKYNITPWILFTIFVFGPCEPLIPILMYPASQHNILGVIIVTLVFSITTISTMLAITFLSSFGLKFIPLGKLERFSHALAGGIIFLSGMSIQFLGL